jgi:hypothetical protein
LVKIGLFANLIGWTIGLLLLALAETWGSNLFEILTPSEGPLINLLVVVFMGLLFGLFGSLLFIVGALTTRLLGRRGPTLEIRDSGAGLARHFE